MEKTIIVYYKEEGLIIHKIIAERLNLYHGYRIKTEKEFWDILRQNASHVLLLCQAKIDELKQLS